MINGSLDPATPLAEARRVGDHFAGREQTFVVIEGGAHGFGAPLPDGSSCAETMIDAFVRDPRAPVDDCGARVLPPSFEGLPVLASTLFGTGHLWDEASPDAITYVPPPDPALAARAREVLRGPRFVR